MSGLEVEVCSWVEVRSGIDLFDVISRRLERFGSLEVNLVSFAGEAKIGKYQLH